MSTWDPACTYVTGPAWMCSACLYVEPAPDADRSELDLLTVINGHLVCVRHASCARGNHHDVLKAAVHLESGGKITSLSEYQDWRAKQDAA